MAEIDIEIEGFDDVVKAIKKLSKDKDKTKQVRQILRRVATDAVTTAKRKAPVSSGLAIFPDGRISKRKYRKVAKKGKIPFDPGNLRDSIKVQIMFRASNPMVIVGPRSLGRNDGFYGRMFVIPGYNIYRAGFKRNRRGNRKFNSTGARSRVPANPFIAETYKETKGRMSEKAKKKLERFFQKKIKEL